MKSPMKLFAVQVLLVCTTAGLGFLLSPSSTSGGFTSTSGGFIRAGSKNTPTDKPDYSVYVLPGTLVPPSRYEYVCRQIGSLCTANNITVDVSIAKFTLNVGHRFETKSMSKRIVRDARSDNIVLVGHSASAVVGADIAADVKAVGFVQWCGTFNSNGDFPWDCVDPYQYDFPIMTILSEQDSMFSFATAVREFRGSGASTDFHRVIPTSIRNAGHFSGIYAEEKARDSYDDLPKSVKNTLESTAASHSDLFKMDVVSISWRISEFIGLLSGLPGSTKRVYEMENHFRSKYHVLGSSFYPDDVGAMLYGNDSSTASVNHVHSVNPPGFLYALLYAAFPRTRPVVTLCTVILPFVFTPPSESRSISVTSSIVNPFPGAVFSNPSIWAKVPYAGPADFSRKVNIETFENALSEVSEKDRVSYLDYGKPLVFERDTEIPKVPGCGLAWVSTPLVTKSEDAYTSVSSPVVRMGATLNTKLISRKQCLEWILIKCFG